MIATQQLLSTRPGTLHRPARPKSSCSCGNPWSEAEARKTGMRDVPSMRWRLSCDCGRVLYVGEA